MLKILTTKQIREADEFTIKHQPIASTDLMENACRAFVDWFVDHFHGPYSILVVCGTGNNGGDGLGIARLLHKKKYDVQVIVIRISQSQSADFNKNLSRLPKMIKIATIGESDPIEFPESEIIIDAIFGSGLSRPLEGVMADAILELNNKKSIRIAVDCPSGFMMDSTLSSDPCIRADHTVTFQVPKLSFLFPQSFPLVGHWHLVDIGLDKNFIENSESNYFLIDKESVGKIIRPRSKFNHKGNYGHSLIMAGSLGKIGANILATKAALRAGGGLVTSLTPSCGYVSLQTAVPEAMVISDPGLNELTQLPDLESFNAVGIGPGMGTSEKTIELIAILFKSGFSNIVLDADAINIISSNQTLQNLVPNGSILTPHPGEFKRLAGEWANDFEKLDKQKALASKLNSIIILKGAHTSIALPGGEVYFNCTGNPAMATGGSGDVLTGIITGLLAQGYSPKDASILGVYWHGLAGDYALESRSTIIASDIIEALPGSLKWLLAVQQIE